MFEISDISFISSYMSSLDTMYDMPLISNYDIENDDEVSLSFIENTIINLYASKDMKWGRFSDESEVGNYVSIISEDMSNYKEYSKKIIDKYFDILKNNYDIPGGELIVSLFEMDEVQYLGFFKYNFKTMYTSYFESLNENKNITIKKKSSLFASSRHKADEGFIVHLPHMDICMVDKKYNILNEKSFILGENLLKCSSSNSEKEKLNMFNNVTKNIEKKYLLNNLEKKAQLKKAVKDTIIDNGFININDVIDKSFDYSPELKEIYTNSLEKTGLKLTDNIEIDGRTLKTKFETQKISTESGISIDIPIDYYGDDDKIEFIPNDNGTVSIVIKNVKNIIA